MGFHQPATAIRRNLSTPPEINPNKTKQAVLYQNVAIFHLNRKWGKMYDDVPGPPAIREVPAPRRTIVCIYITHIRICASKPEAAGACRSNRSPKTAEPVTSVRYWATASACSPVSKRRSRFPCDPGRATGGAPFAALSQAR